MRARLCQESALDSFLSMRLDGGGHWGRCRRAPDPLWEEQDIA
ncbi:hypothetical protein TPASS_0278 [Treponema pallidum subsp. pallidum SS14]|uniref:Uncharacterized protein TP_0278 n=2 Tax=Treponema pallidum subsp. pallidum TaxID=161 RepID=Y278_TREPA|nr:RecName: Full=Uncharacterized protein TP_0278 [Treponema pallidum subsp. pallidum str. Nichols]AAC65276.1 predicted coding region TP0278 [Treponema pallidum subsp. pallidum str. Nichols]ACD70705.1 hypothetical protein TPASS_0278 [Treponema pallidum subsp. pallidum SS14]ADD72415.1 conserved hypothetical protein [Treponema pallidum subsp. pallidum str. Chicago]